MSIFWQNSGRAALLEALTKACDEVGPELDNEYRVCQQERDSLLAQLGQKNDELAETKRRLEGEVTSLQETVVVLSGYILSKGMDDIDSILSGEAAKHDGQEDGTARAGKQTTPAPTPTPKPARAAAAAAAAAPLPTAAPTSHSELQEKFDRLHSRYTILKEQLRSAVDMAQFRKRQAMGWMDYAQKQDQVIRRQREAKKRHREGAAVALAPTLAPAPAAGAAGVAAVQPHPSDSVDTPRSMGLSSETVIADSFENGEAVVTPPSGGNGQSTDVAKANGVSESVHPIPTPGHPSTQEEPDEQPPLPQMPTLRASGDSALKDRNSSSGRPHVAVKQEPSSDGPEMVWERPVKRARHGDGPDETPRAIVKADPDEAAGGVLGGFKVAAAVCSSPAHPLPSQESVDLDEGQLPMPTPRKRHIVYTIAALRSSSEPPEAETGEAAEAEHTNMTKSFGALDRHAMAPLSTNIRRVLPEQMRSKSKGVSGTPQSEGFSSMLHSTPVRHNPRSTPRAGSSRATRLQTLLHSRPTDPSPVTPVPRPMANGDTPRTGFQQQSEFGLPPPPRSLDFTTARVTRSLGANTANKNAASAKAAKTTTGPASTLSKGKPLRGRSVDELQPSDFKINAARNDGKTFAFDEVVRGRAARAELAGCTDPQCCGKVFRGMAESELNAAGPGHASRREALILMERFLGDDASRLTLMDPEEKRALWVEARTKELADTHGKHRHRFRTRASPPGFWDAEFPSTQEAAEQRAEAERLKRATVLERYREAMRPGGRWLFRDE